MMPRRESASPDFMSSIDGVRPNLAFFLFLCQVQLPKSDSGFWMVLVGRSHCLYLFLLSESMWVPNSKLSGLVPRLLHRWWPWLDLQP